MYDIASRSALPEVGAGAGAGAGARRGAGAGVWCAARLVSCSTRFTSAVKGACIWALGITFAAEADRTN